MVAGTSARMDEVPAQAFASATATYVHQVRRRGVGLSGVGVCCGCGVINPVKVGGHRTCEHRARQVPIPPVAYQHGPCRPSTTGDHRREHRAWRGRSRRDLPRCRQIVVRSAGGVQAGLYRERAQKGRPRRPWQQQGCRRVQSRYRSRPTPSVTRRHSPAPTGTSARRGGHPRWADTVRQLPLARHTPYESQRSPFARLCCGRINRRRAQTAIDRDEHAEPAIIGRARGASPRRCSCAPTR